MTIIKESMLQTE